MADLIPAEERFALGGGLVVALSPVDLLFPPEDRVAAHDVDAGVYRAPRPVEVEADERDDESEGHNSDPHRKKLIMSRAVAPGSISSAR